VGIGGSYMCIYPMDSPGGCRWLEDDVAHRQFEVDGWPARVGTDGWLTGLETGAAVGGCGIQGGFWSGC